MTLYTFTFLCAFSVLAVLQVPGTLAGKAEPNHQSQDEQAETEKLLKKLEMKWDAAVAAKAQELANTCPVNLSPQNSTVIHAAGCKATLYTSNSTVTLPTVIQDAVNKVKDLVIQVVTVAAEVLGSLVKFPQPPPLIIGCAEAYCPTAEKSNVHVCVLCPA